MSHNAQITEYFPDLKESKINGGEYRSVVGNVYRGDPAQWPSDHQVQAQRRPPSHTSYFPRAQGIEINGGEYMAVGGNYTDTRPHISPWSVQHAAQGHSAGPPSQMPANPYHPNTYQGHSSVDACGRPISSYNGQQHNGPIYTSQDQDESQQMNGQVTNHRAHPDFNPPKQTNNTHGYQSNSPLSEYHRQNTLQSNQVQMPEAVAYPVADTRNLAQHSVPTMPTSAASVSTRRTMPSGSSRSQTADARGVRSQDIDNDMIVNEEEVETDEETVPGPSKNGKKSKSGFKLPKWGRKHRA